MRASARLLLRALRSLTRLQSRRLGDHRLVVLRALRPDSLREGDAAVGALRARLQSDRRILDIEDHGAGTRGIVGSEEKPDRRTVAEIYARAAAPPVWGSVLFGLVRELKPRRVLELGTSLGVSAAHLASALALNERHGGVAGHLVTIEGDPGLADLARENLERLGHAGRATVIAGRFNDVLDSVKTDHGPFDLVFVDGHHAEDATMAYWRSIKPALRTGACVAFDDIEPGRPVRRAWKRIVAEERPAGAGAVDLVGLGLLFMPRP